MVGKSELRDGTQFVENYLLDLMHGGLSAGTAPNKLRVANLNAQDLQFALDGRDVAGLGITREAIVGGKIDVVVIPYNKVRAGEKTIRVCIQTPNSSLLIMAHARIPLVHAGQLSLAALHRGRQAAHDRRDGLPHVLRE